ncbi:MAG: hypothetical protein WCD79_19170 [Chthoniobacteraceae bacterium]
MKRTLFAIIIGLGLITGMEPARAQNDEKPVPKAPYLAAVPDYGHWIVTFKYDDAATANDAKQPAPANKFASTIDTIKTADLRGVVLTFPDGTTRQFTCQGDWVLASTPKGPQLGIAGRSWVPYVYYTKGFILLDGVKIDLTTFKETGKHNDVLAFHYKSGDEDVWIATETMLPLAVKKQNVEASYQFLPAPPRPFSIPADQAALLKKQEDADKALHSLR